jgi:hypothetical protein
MGDEDLPRSFRTFLEPGTDRFGFLLAHLRERRLSPSTVELAGSRHIVVASGRPAVPSKPRIVLAAHYDRAPGSPGANDNSAAVFQLAEAAARLRADGTDSWLVVFTDREEAACGRGASGQGAYALAEGFKAIAGGARFFIFDACGRETPSSCPRPSANLPLTPTPTPPAGRPELRIRALETGRVAARGGYCSPRRRSPTTPASWPQGSPPRPSRCCPPEKRPPSPAACGRNPNTPRRS